MLSATQLIVIFNEAKSRPMGVERDQFLEKACGDNPELKSQVLSLLQAHEAAGDFLKQSIVSRKALNSETPGDTIGRYKLLERIGEGGCGVVYVAEQVEPVRRRVALKVIKLGMDTKQVVARFEAERQALAMMDHANIAKVLDAGSTDDGPALLRDGAGPGRPHHRVLRPEQLSARRNVSNCSSESAKPSSTRTRRESSTGTSSLRISWSPCTMERPCPK